MPQKTQFRDLVIDVLTQDGRSCFDPKLDGFLSSEVQNLIYAVVLHQGKEVWSGMPKIACAGKRRLNYDIRDALAWEAQEWVTTNWKGR